MQITYNVVDDGSDLVSCLHLRYLFKSSISVFNIDLVAVHRCSGSHNYQPVILTRVVPDGKQG